jgi:hypothetical protein
MRSAESMLSWPAIHVNTIVTLARSTTTRKGSLRVCEGALGLETPILVEANVTQDKSKAHRILTKDVSRGNLACEHAPHRTLRTSKKQLRAQPLHYHPGGRRLIAHARVSCDVGMILCTSPEGSKYGMDDYLQLKTVVTGGTQIVHRARL